MRQDPNIQAGMEALRSGDEREARRRFGIAVKEDPDNFIGWWYLATILKDNEQRMHCLRQVLRLRPNHTEAKQMLLQLEKQTARPTPAEGMSRPVLDGKEHASGVVTAPLPPKPQPEPEPVPVYQTPEPAEQSAIRSSNNDILTLAAVTIVALLSILGTVVLVFTGNAPGVLGVNDPNLQPTLVPVQFDVPACTVTTSAPQLVFINNTGVLVEVSQGAEGEEEFQFGLEPNAQQAVEVEPEVTVRYFAQPIDPTLAGAGVNIQVPSGNSCRVPIGGIQ